MGMQFRFLVVGQPNFWWRPAIIFCSRGHQFLIAASLRNLRWPAQFLVAGQLSFCGWPATTFCRRRQHFLVAVGTEIGGSPSSNSEDGGPPISLPTADKKCCRRREKVVVGQPPKFRLVSASYCGWRRAFRAHGRCVRFLMRGFVWNFNTNGFPGDASSPRSSLVLLARVHANLRQLARKVEAGHGQEIGLASVRDWGWPITQY